MALPGRLGASLSALSLSSFFSSSLLFLLLILQLSTIFPSSVQAYDPSANCTDALLSLYDNSTEVLALMFDASGKSIDDLGKWDQCRDLGSDVAKYCTIRFAIHIPIPTPYIGVCLPVQCNTSDFAAYAVAGFELVTGLAEAYKINITKYLEKIESYVDGLVQYENDSGVWNVDCIGDTPSVQSSKGGMTMVVICFVLIAFVLIGTALEGFDANWWPEKDLTGSIGDTPGPIGGIQDDSEVKPLLHKEPVRRSRLFEFFVAFSVVKNFKALVGPSPPSLAFLNGMRAISITWVILGHSLDYMNYAGVLNFAHVITHDVQRTSAQVFPAAEFSVDSFFWLSGFLVTYLTVNELKTRRRVNWVLYYFHRVWRLSPAYYFALFFYMCISVYLGNGPMWPKYEYMVESTCGKYWWTNLLYVNNFIPSDWNGQCFLWGWYLAVDMQLYIIAPIIFMLYYKNKYLGWTLVSAMIAATTVLNGVYAHQNNLVWDATDPHVYMSLVYGKPYTRAAPWLLGILCGFLYLEKRQLHRVVVYIGWLISGAIMLLCVYGPVTEFSGGSNELDPPQNTWNSTTNLLYFTFAKLGWSVALSFLMHSMAMGWGGFVRRFLGAHFWSPLARLTYSTYLFHPIIIFVTYYSHLQYFSFDQYSFSIIFVGTTFLSFCTAALIFLTVERPMTNMEKLFLPHKKH